MNYPPLELRLIVLAVSAAFANVALAQANLPTGNTTAAGTAAVSTIGNDMTVSTSNRAVINWQTFNIANGYSVTFSQAGTSAITVNRVADTGGLSTINGGLNPNGTVMILNSNGVLFGPNASVNVGGLVASTGKFEPADFTNFLSGGPVAITGATSGSVVNQGTINVTGAGLVAFVAPS